jgi:hypothetical protein
VGIAGLSGSSESFGLKAMDSGKTLPGYCCGCKHHDLPAYREHRNNDAVSGTRDLGIAPREYVARIAKLNDILDRAHLEDFVVENEDRSLTDVALEMLVRGMDPELSHY